MNNQQLLDRLEQCYGARIDRMFWIPGQWQITELVDMIQDMDDDDLRKCFPDIFERKYEKHLQDPHLTVETLFDFRKLGILAEVHFPQCDNFTYDGDRPSCWSVHEGICLVGYVYAETLEELVERIEADAERHFKWFVVKDRAKNKDIAQGGVNVDS